MTAIKQQKNEIVMAIEETTEKQDVADIKDIEETKVTIDVIANESTEECNDHDSNSKIDKSRKICLNFMIFTRKRMST